MAPPLEELAPAGAPEAAAPAPSAPESVRGADQPIGTIEREADQGTDGRDTPQGAAPSAPPPPPEEEPEVWFDQPIGTIEGGADQGTGGPGASQGAAPEEEPEVWFEVSGTTGRVHLHAAADGSAPLGLSIPAETLLARGGASPLLEDLLKAVDKRCAPSFPLLTCTSTFCPQLSRVLRLKSATKIVEQDLTALF